jgi:hypothetical protein
MRAIQASGFPVSAKRLKAYRQTEFLHAARIGAVRLDVLVQHVTVDVLLELLLKVIRNQLASRLKRIEWFRIERHRGLDVSDRRVVILMPGGSGCEPGVDVGWLAAGLARAGVDLRDRVLDNTW